MTEAEAKTKWCPMVRLTTDDNRSMPEPKNPATSCIGSACMMFRSHTETTRTLRGDTGYIITNHYCGLGGRP